MRRPVGLLAVGLAVLLVQGALATFAPPFAAPDLLFLVAVGTAVAVGGAEGLVVAALLGYAMDLLTGALLGQHALLLVMAYGATRVASLQLNLLRAAPLVVFIAVLTLCYDLGHAGLTRLMRGSVGLEWSDLGHVAVHALVNAVFARPAVGAVQRCAALLAGDEEAGRRTLRVEARGRRI